jgi:hypothetical protein
VTPSGGATPKSAELELRSDLDPADFADGLAAVVREMRSTSSGPQMGDQQHYEQGGTWTGTLRIGDEQVRGEGLFVRDHSWGIRHEHQDFTAFWTASCLDEGRMFCNAIGIPRAGGVTGVGAIVDSAGPRWTTEVAARFEPAAGLASYDGATISYGAPINTVLDATTHLHLPVYLPHSGPRRYDNNAISRVEMDGRTGFGVIEWAAVLAEHDDLLVAAADTDAPAVKDALEGRR